MSRPSAKTPAPPAGGQVCALFAVDIAGFTGPHRDDDIRLYLHEELYQFLHKAFDGSGIPWADCFCEDRGDGALIVVPPVVPYKGLINTGYGTLIQVIGFKSSQCSGNVTLFLRTVANNNHFI